MKYIRQISCLLALLLSPLSISVDAQEVELLAPEQAFALTAWIEGDSLIAEYQIAPGYYMYRERFNFQIETTGADLSFGNSILPKGKIKNDEFFGDQEVYRNSVRIELPLLVAGERSHSFQVAATGQGCADIGVCYPPLKQALAVDTNSAERILPVAWVATNPGTDKAIQNVTELQALLGQFSSTSQTDQQSQINQPVESGALAILKSLGNDIGLNNDDEILHPDEAFKLSASLDTNNVVQTNILLAPHIYIYRDKIKIEMIQGSGHKLGPVSLPRGKKKNDEFFGPSEVIYDQISISIPVISDTDASDQYTISYGYQGCVEDRICYPPITKYLSVDTASGLIKVVNDNADVAGNSVPGIKPDSTPLSEQDQYTKFLTDKSLLIVLALFFVAGIGLTFTPCVFPMIPILSSIIAGQGSSITTHKAFYLSLVYVLSMAITYATIGAIVGYYGAEFNIQIWFQDPLILSTFAAVFILLALSMFGFYEIQMPSAIQSRLASLSNSQKGGTLIGVGLMGFFSAIIVGPCITAPLVGALIYISQTQNWQLGGLSLFALGLGMGLPLLLIGTSAGKLLPRAGHWMDRVKSVFGVLLLAVAIYLLERILPAAITMALIGALMIGSSIYLGALDSLNQTASGWHRFGKAAGILLLIYGSAYLIGAASGSKELIQPLRGIVSSASEAGGLQQKLEFRQIKGSQGLQVALNDATRQNRTTMLDFYADWCISCKEMEKYTFSDAAVLQALDTTSLLQADVTANDNIDIELMTSLGIYGPPAILFFDRTGKEIAGRRVVGFMSAEDFSAHVRSAFQ